MTEDGKLDLEDLKMMSSAMISNTMAAEVLRMDPGRLAEYARTGQLGWKVLAPEDGSRVYHNRKDFIRFWTCEPNNEQPERTVEDLLDEISTKMDLLLGAITALMNQSQRREFVETWADQEDKKTAGAATPTD